MLANRGVVFASWGHLHVKSLGFSCFFLFLITDYACLLFQLYNACFFTSCKTNVNQVNDYKKKLEDQSAAIEGFEEAKKKAAHDSDALQQRVESLTDENDKLGKSKKKLQAEVSIEVSFDYEYFSSFFSRNFIH
jgi:hypothetical protein